MTRNFRRGDFGQLVREIAQETASGSRGVQER